MTIGETDPSEIIALFHVAPFDDVWMVTRNGRSLKLGLTIEIAVTDAVTAAIEAHKQGMQSEVLFSSGTETQTLWLNGRLVPENTDVLDTRRGEFRRWAA